MLLVTRLIHQFWCSQDMHCPLSFWYRYNTLVSTDERMKCRFQIIRTASDISITAVHTKVLGSMVDLRLCALGVSVANT